MNEVFNKTRELGEALMASDEYVTMKAAEEAATNDEAVSSAMSDYFGKKRELEGLMEDGEGDPEAMRRLSAEMDALLEQLSANELFVRMNEARGAFTNLISQVNQVLRFIITGEIGAEDDEEDGCGGNCGSCSGHCHTLN